MTMRLITTILAALALAQAALAADSTPSTPSDPYLERFEAAKSRRDWTAAAGVMREALAAKPDNADYHNLYAYSLRKGGTREMDLVFKHYNEALRLDPRHRAAHEYLGEAYLMVGNVERAKQELKALDELCFFGCTEYSALKKAIAAHGGK